MANTSQLANQLKQSEKVVEDTQKALKKQLEDERRQLRPQVESLQQRLREIDQQIAAL